jgi:hypothetical protein
LPFPNAAPPSGNGPQSPFHRFPGGTALTPSL